MHAQADVLCGQGIRLGRRVFLDLLADFLIDLDEFKLPLKLGAAVTLYGFLPAVRHAIPLEPEVARVGWQVSRRQYERLARIIGLHTAREMCNADAVRARVRRPGRRRRCISIQGPSSVLLD